MTGAEWIVVALVGSAAITTLEVWRRHIVGVRFVRLQRAARR